MSRLNERLRSFAGPVSSRLPERLSGQMLQPLIVLCLGAGALAGFIGVADNLLEGDTHQIDRAILLALRTAEDTAEPIGPAWAQEVFADITALGGYPILTLVSLIAAAYLAILRQWGSIMLLLISLLGGTGLSTLFKDLFDRPRPDLAPTLSRYRRRVSRVAMPTPLPSPT